jgi:hypothetical protein
MGASGKSNQTLIRHDFKRACYRAMLSEFSIEEVKEFFSLVPLIIDGIEYKGSELYELLWKANAKIPRAYGIATDNELEAFFLSKGRRVPEMLDKILWLNNKSSVMPGRVLLTWIYPKLEYLFNSLDIRDVVFNMISIHNENWLPQVIHRRIKKWEEGEWVKSLLVFMEDKSFEKYDDWDFELIGGPQILAAPAALGLPRFERFSLLSDCRPPERIIWEPRDYPWMVGEELRIRGECFGKRISFFDFCRARDVDVGNFHPPDLPVIEITQDYFCEKRDRVVLHKGCAYGAPMFLHLVEHRKPRFRERIVLDNIFGDLSREDELQNDELEGKHRALLQSFSENTVIEYRPSDESLTLNGGHFMRGVSAKIFRFLAKAYADNGKSEFEYREMKRLFEITMGQKNSNFEVRFNRLKENLEEKCRNVKIEKTGRGKFRLIVKGDLHYREIGEETRHQPAR